MTLSEHQEWQRRTALRRVKLLRNDAANNDAPVSEDFILTQAANYVGATLQQVRLWVRGQDERA